ncbi:MAG: 2-oxoglutarate dehydrogenase E1 component [Armatimonadota bacterium]|nr:2-oxoglutarate dehydrogenase E1 component [Armatimonadota bacterium]
MSDLEEFYGPNAGYVLELYDRFRQNPDSVDAATRAAFQNWTPPAETPVPRNGTAPTSLPAAPQIEVMKVVGAARAARLVRVLGHLTAHIDPLGSEPPGDPGLELATHGLTTDDLAVLPASVVGGPLAEGAKNSLEALGRLRQAYSGSIGYEDSQIQNPSERDWLRDAAESRQFFGEFRADEKRQVLERLTEVEGLEQFLHKNFQGAKRFSIEGVDILVPMLDRIIHEAAISHTHEVVIGMAHRGRLNVLAHILGKPYTDILQEFKSSKQDESASVAGGSQQGYSGDVIYHGGARKDFSDNGVEEMPITLTPNPSHLEFVDPVVEGRARAAQEQRKKPGAPEQNPEASLAILIHGDAAFPGQGIVPETLNLSRLPGYSVGGTVHIITNNQIGFTTLPGDSRSTLYASDLAKGFEIPIVHVNADDAEACIAAARMAFAYRQKFGKDFLIDLVGYRRWGHNEGEEPAYTQPGMYETIKAHPTVREIWAKELERQGVATRDEAQGMVSAMIQRLTEARNTPSGKGLQKGVFPDGLAELAKNVKTNVPALTLIALNEEMLARPAGFTPNAKLERVIFLPRRAALMPGGLISWAHAEALAFASILADGTPIRLSGQDSQAGTFSQRHLVLHDPTTDETFCPLQAIPDARASFAVVNSPLSENAVLGFEYGYSIHATGCLVLWEAQFGDFANGAQVIIDQFLTAGNAKWQQTPSLILLLPHGYEGQGPEHSSARLERFLQLAANDNMRVAYCTTAAQYFHVLRRQAALLWDAPRPLVLMTPKGLLKVDKPPVASTLQDLAEGAFQPVLDDPRPRERAGNVTRLVLCSGKVYVDLVGREDYAAAENVAVARIEELYPFPDAELAKVIQGYPNLREVIWLQEEPRNMGAWVFVSSRIRALLPDGLELTYVGRPKAASPSEGSKRRHDVEQSRFLAAALSDAPKKNSNLNGANGAKSKRSAAIHAR